MAPLWHHDGTTVGALWVPIVPGRTQYQRKNVRIKEHVSGSEHAQGLSARRIHTLHGTTYQILIGGLTPLPSTSLRMRARRSCNYRRKLYEHMATCKHLVQGSFWCVAGKTIICIAFIGRHSGTYLGAYLTGRNSRDVSRHISGCISSYNSSRCAQNHDKPSGTYPGTYPSRRSIIPLHQNSKSCGCAIFEFCWDASKPALLGVRTAAEAPRGLRRPQDARGGGSVGRDLQKARWSCTSSKRTYNSKISRWKCVVSGPHFLLLLCCERWIPKWPKNDQEHKLKNLQKQLDV